jgi:hypothetical protein
MDFMNEFSFTNFILALKSAGFISSKLINSQMTLDFAYTLYLILSDDKTIDKAQIKRLVSKWYVFSTLTSRYISSPETVMDMDIRRIAEHGFMQYLADLETAELSDAFWDVGLVQSLETSSVNGPGFSVFLAAQIHASDNSLMMNGTKVRDLITTMGDIHHIFPKKHLQESGITDRAKYNQIANYTYLDTQTNIVVGDAAPREYFRVLFDQCATKELKLGNIIDFDLLKENLAANCIPESIVDMDAANYEEFLLERRRLMARKIKDYYFSL